MRFVQHPTNNAVLGAPPGMDSTQCHALPITRVRYEDGMHGVWSYWKPSAEELGVLAAGGFVRLGVLGSTMPPVMLEAAT